MAKRAKVKIDDPAAVVAERCKSAATTLIKVVQIAIQSRALMDVPNDDPGMREVFDHTEAAAGLNAVQHALMEGLLLQVMKCWDGSSSNRASLPSLSDWLARPDVVELFLTEAAAWNPKMDRADIDRDLAYRKIAELRDGVQLQECPEQAERRARLRGFRNTFVAHSLTSELVRFPRYADIFSLLDETIPLVGAASLALLGTHEGFDDWQDISTRIAKRFWSPVRRGQQMERGRHQALFHPSRWEKLG